MFDIWEQKNVGIKKQQKALAAVKQTNTQPQWRAFISYHTISYQKVKITAK